MSQANPEKKGRRRETPKTESKQYASATAAFKLNVHASEFIPISHTHLPFSACFPPYFQFLDGVVVGTGCFYLSDQDSCPLLPNSKLPFPKSSKNALLGDLQQKIMKQVEYLFSDLSLLANGTMEKHVSKGPEGYVPIAAIASMKKIKALVYNNHNLLTRALCSSSKLVVSDDFKKVRRRILFSENYRGDLQCRTVVAENLPDDHSYQNLQKIFGVVGSVKAIRLCHPQEADSCRSYANSNKFHALVEYENAKTAERAAENLNDERNWRKGLRVRLLLKCSPKSVLKFRKPDFNIFANYEEELRPESLEDSLLSNGSDFVADINDEGKSAGSKKAIGHDRGKAKGRGQVHNGVALLTTTTQIGRPTQCEEAKQTNMEPRMPDGTRGFAMGRGKPLNSPDPAGPYVE
ncbi:hypothetical protein Nepgr_015262 [Nepenthes gracilis]|uniref:La-related protein 6C n=1 Tax=Nepenthes gracilis TaxID=150966 RepID=A0AAD3SNB6_NEPGR|nr:hypothetical protein Nepgr_015262 [Nepenthes gracilis]